MLTLFSGERRVHTELIKEDLPEPARPKSKTLKLSPWENKVSVNFLQNFSVRKEKILKRVSKLCKKKAKLTHDQGKFELLQRLLFCIKNFHGKVGAEGSGICCELNLGVQKHRE